MQAPNLAYSFNTKIRNFNNKKLTILVPLDVNALYS